MAQSIKLVANSSEIEQYHKLGVAVPGFRNNHSFNYGRPYASVLQLGSETASSKVFPAYTNPYIPQLLRPGDRISIGPSTAPGYVGAIENRVITAVHPDFITLNSALLNLYSIDDEVTAVGSRFPAGWDYSNGFDGSSPFSRTKLWYPYGGISDLDNLAAANKVGAGFSNDFRFYLQWGVDDGSGTGNYSPLVKRDFGNVLIGNTFYRFGCYIKVNTVDFNTIKMKVSDGDSDIVTLDLTYSSGAFREIIGVSNALTPTPSACLVTLYNNSASVGHIIVDNIYMEHAKNTTGSGSGVYTFTELPELGSETVDKVEQTEFTLRRTMTGAGYRFQEAGLGFGVEKFTYSMNFDNVADTFYNTLRELIRWQKRGYDLVFHPNSYLCYQSKPVVYSNITISEFRYNTFNHERVSFTLLIEEV